MILDRDKDGTWYLVVTAGSPVNWVSDLKYAQFKAIDGKWQQVEFDKSLDGRDANLEYTLKGGKMPKEIFLHDKPLNRVHPKEFKSNVQSRYKYINLDTKYW